MLTLWRRTSKKIDVIHVQAKHKNEKCYCVHCKPHLKHLRKSHFVHAPAFFSTGHLHFVLWRILVPLHFWRGFPLRSVPLFGGRSFCLTFWHVVGFVNEVSDSVTQRLNYQSVSWSRVCLTLSVQSINTSGIGQGFVIQSGCWWALKTWNDRGEREYIMDRAGLHRG